MSRTHYLHSDAMIVYWNEKKNDTGNNDIWDAKHTWQGIGGNRHRILRTPCTRGRILSVLSDRCGHRDHAIIFSGDVSSHSKALREEFQSRDSTKDVCQNTYQHRCCYTRETRDAEAWLMSFAHACVTAAAICHGKVSRRQTERNETRAKREKKDRSAWVRLISNACVCLWTELLSNIFCTCKRCNVRRVSKRKMSFNVPRERTMDVSFPGENSEIKRIRNIEM